MFANTPSKKEPSDLIKALDANKPLYSSSSASDSASVSGSCERRPGPLVKKKLPEGSKTLGEMLTKEEEKELRKFEKEMVERRRTYSAY